MISKSKVNDIDLGIEEKMFQRATPRDLIQFALLNNEDDKINESRYSSTANKTGVVTFVSPKVNKLDDGDKNNNRISHQASDTVRIELIEKESSSKILAS